MAHEYWDVNRGQRETDVIVGTSSGSGNVEVVVDLSKNMTREEVFEALHYIMNFMLKNIWPPA